MNTLTYLTICVAAAMTGGCGAGQGSGSFMRKVFGPSPAELTRQMFESPDPDLRREAVERLSGHSWGRRDPYLKGYAALTRDGSVGVRAAAVGALGRSRDARYVKDVIAALSDPEMVVRWDAAKALDAMVDEQAVEPLARSSTADEAVEVRSAAARSLRRHRQEKALSALLACLEDPDFTVRYEARESLAELTGESFPPDAEAWRMALADKRDPYSRTPATRKSPWWDWLGVTDKKPPARSTGPKKAPTPPSPAGKRPPAFEPASAEKPKRPWWDWLGVTDKKDSPARRAVPRKAPPHPSPAAKNPPTFEPASAEKPKRPWWDWLGVTDKKDSPTRAVPRKAPPHPSPAAAAKRPPTFGPASAEKPKRPWWDWLGVTDKKDSPARAVPRKAPAHPSQAVNRPPTFGPASAEKPKRPWWDWLGVTDKKKPAPAPAPRETPPVQTPPAPPAPGEER